MCLTDNTVQVKRAEAEWVPFEPKRDGRPLLAGATVHQAQLAGDVLALTITRPGERRLVLFRGPDGRVLGEAGHDHRSAPFALSADGRRIARRRGSREVVVSDTAGPAAAVAVATLAGLHNDLRIAFAGHPMGLLVWVGSFRHALWIAEGRLHHAQRQEGEPAEIAHKHPTTLPVSYDDSRFAARGAVEAGPWRAVPDRLGQVLLYGPAGLVAAFLVRRVLAAAWIPGGVFWGSPALIGGPPTPDADLKIGRAIAAAAGG